MTDSLLEKAAIKVGEIGAFAVIYFGAKFLIGKGVSRTAIAWAIVALFPISILVGIPLAIVLTDRTNSRKASSQGRRRSRVSRFEYDDGSLTARFWFGSLCSRVFSGAVVGALAGILWGLLLFQLSKADPCSTLMGTASSVAAIGFMVGLGTGAFCTVSADTDGPGEGRRAAALYTIGVVGFLAFLSLCFLGVNRAFGWGPEEFLNSKDLRLIRLLDRDNCGVISD